MAKRSKKNDSQDKVIEFVLDENEPIWSAVNLKPAPAKKAAPKKKAEKSTAKTAAPTEKKAKSPKAPAVEAKASVRDKETLTSAPKTEAQPRSAAAKELELPKLPVLEKQDRAVLQVQAPNRAFFYWSLKANPFQALRRTLGAEASSYTLVLRLLEIQTEREELHPIEPDGSWWFDTEAGRTYRAEIGFYSTSRPFIRILFSNTVTTPRKSPSRRAADGSEWRVTADKFAEVLDATGFSRDAFDVVLTGDDASATDNLTHIAFARLIGETARTVESISTEEIRYAMLAIASGRSLEEIRFQVGAALFAVLQANTERLTPQKAAAVLNEYFEIDEIVFEEEEAAATVFGASLVHFPKKFRTRYDYSPVSSHITR